MNIKSNDGPRRNLRIAIANGFAVPCGICRAPLTPGSWDFVHSVRIDGQGTKGRKQIIDATDADGGCVAHTACAQRITALYNAGRIATDAALHAEATNAATVAAIDAFPASVIDAKLELANAEMEWAAALGY